jgi:hypothetical protein
MHQLLVDGDNPDVVQNCFTNDTVTDRLVLRIEHLRKNDVDMVTRPDQPGGAADRVNTDADRALARAKHRGKEAVITWPHHVGRQDHVFGRQATAHHGANELAAPGWCV